MISNDQGQYIIYSIYGRVWGIRSDVDNSLNDRSNHCKHCINTDPIGVIFISLYVIIHPLGYAQYVPLSRPNFLGII